MLLSRGTNCNCCLQPPLETGSQLGCVKSSHNTLPWALTHMCKWTRTFERETRASTSLLIHVGCVSHRARTSILQRNTIHVQLKPKPLSSFETRLILAFSIETHIDNKWLWCICFQFNKDKMSTKFEKDILFIQWVKTRKTRQSKIISPWPIVSLYSNIYFWLYPFIIFLNTAFFTMFEMKMYFQS